MSHCPRCGNPTAGSAFCPACGSPQTTADDTQSLPQQPSDDVPEILQPDSPPPAAPYVTPPHQQLPPSMPQPLPQQVPQVVVQQTPRSSPAVAITAVIAGAVVLVVGLGVLFLTLRDGSSSDTATQGGAVASEASTPADASSTTEASPTAQSPATRSRNHHAGSGPATGTRDVATLRAGLFCRDLYARGYSYVAAVNYWRLHGNPNQMDIDRNGIPCQTVYSPSDVSAYWGVHAVPQQIVTSVQSLPSGLFCRDLYASGYSYSDAVNYWFYHGQPDQMDIDLNGVPCETVYPWVDIQTYWYG